MTTVSRTSDISKKIGIWGLGISGQKLLPFLHKKNYTISVLERPEKIATLAPMLSKYPCEKYFDPRQRDLFFATCDYIIPSPGIELPDALYCTKIMSELDFFAQYNDKTTIGITGTLGKTSTTTLLTNLLNQTKERAVTGGNIGNGIIDVLEQKADIAVLELSSFQLERAATYAPDIAIITNFFANHLDRHKTISAYKEAKLNLLRSQTNRQLAIINCALAEETAYQLPTNAKTIVFGQPKTIHPPKDITHVYLHADGSIVKSFNGTTETLLPKEQVPSISFPENWLIITAVLEYMGHLNLLLHPTTTYTLPEHRMELVRIHNGIRYINDSKSTLMESTRAAIQQLHAPEKTILLLGGLSKGVDRTSLLDWVANCKHVVCFGHEAELLGTACKKRNIATTMQPDLEKALTSAIQTAKTGDTILLSPGGSSYDLFHSYEERGTFFKQLIKALP